MEHTVRECLPVKNRIVRISRSLWFVSIRLTEKKKNKNDIGKNKIDLKVKSSWSCYNNRPPSTTSQIHKNYKGKHIRYKSPVYELFLVVILMSIFFISPYLKMVCLQ